MVGPKLDKSKLVEKGKHVTVRGAEVTLQEIRERHLRGLRIAVALTGVVE